MNDLTLYYFEACPYCQKVLKVIREHNLKIELKDTRADPKNKVELAKINNGITQVPCLVVKGKPMLESDDIVAFLKEHIIFKK